MNIINKFLDSFYISVALASLYEVGHVMSLTL